METRFHDAVTRHSSEPTSCSAGDVPRPNRCLVGAVTGLRTFEDAPEYSFERPSVWNSTRLRGAIPDLEQVAEPHGSSSSDPSSPRQFVTGRFLLRHYRLAPL